MLKTGNLRSRIMAARMFMGVVAFTIALAGIAAAQQPSPPAQPPAAADSPPVGVGPNWRYEKRNGQGGELHQFFCVAPACGPRAAVSYMLYPRQSPATLEQFRDSHQSVVTKLQEQSPGTKVTLIEVKGDEGGKIPSMFVARRVTEYPNGTKDYRVSSSMYGEKYAATLISTSPDEKSASANHALFTIGVMLFANSGLPLAVGADPKK
jgi:hypothetical protein